VPPEAVFGYLEDLSNHVSLAPGSARVLSLGPGDRGLGHAVVRLTGPLGLRRTASTEIIRADAPGFIAGRASVGSRTRACVTWRIAADEDGSGVTLSAAIEAAGPLDALVLRLGGRRWIARRFAAALGVLQRQLQEAAHPHPAPGATGQLRRAGATP
jgi:hypothetical protein